MMEMKRVLEKQADDGAPVVVLRDLFHAYFVGRAEGELAAHPMGAFKSLEAAKAWADHEFTGGEWRAVTVA